MTLETQAAFARRQGVNRSTVNRWAGAGRLVLKDGRVDVDASLALLAQTKGDRGDVAERHHMEREEKRAAAPAANEAREDTEEVRARLREAALRKSISEGRIKAAQADKMEMERDEMAGDLIPREDVEYVLKDYGAMLRTQLDGRAERLGAELGLTPEQIGSLSEADEQVLVELAGKLKEQGVNSE